MPRFLGRRHRQHPVIPYSCRHHIMERPRVACMILRISAHLVFGQFADRVLVLLDEFDGLDRRGRCAGRGGVGYFHPHRLGPDVVVASSGVEAHRRVDHQRHPVTADVVDDVRMSFVDFHHHLAEDAGIEQVASGTAGSRELETELLQLPSDRNDGLTILLVHGNDHDTLVREFVSCAGLTFGVCLAECRSHADHLACRTHLRSEGRVDVDEPVEGEHRLLDRPAGEASTFPDPSFLLDQLLGDKVLAFPYPDCRFDEVDPRCLGDERYGARRPRIHLDQVEPLVLDGELDIHHPPDRESLGYGEGGLPHLIENGGR